MIGYDGRGVDHVGFQARRGHDHVSGVTREDADSVLPVRPFGHAGDGVLAMRDGEMPGDSGVVVGGKGFVADARLSERVDGRVHVEFPGEV